MSSSSSRRRKGRRRPQPKPVEAEIVVERLGGGGDGVGTWRDQPIYAPGLLPGERASVRLTGRRGDGRLAEPRELLEASPDRIEPPCAFAGVCGGCVVQHLAEPAYVAWKEDLFDRALRARGVVAERRLPMLRVEEGRRRVRFAARGLADGQVIGFNVKAGAHIVDIDKCIAAAPKIADAPARLRPLLAQLLDVGEAMDIEVRTSEVGLDFLLVRNRPLDLSEREVIAAFAEAEEAARVAWRADDRSAPEVVAERAQPALDFGGVAATPAPGGFIQPTAGGEAAMAGFAASKLVDARRIADLYAGVGAFALRLADPAHVDAFEGEAAAVGALNRARAAAGLGGFVNGHVRDLARRPLLAAELAPYDGLILDPPRSGAATQAATLADGGPGRVVYLSCAPAAFARDARTLIDGGYRLVEVMPIDQFRWTPHLEAAAYFERTAA